MNNKITIYGNKKELTKLETEFIIRDVILLQDCSSINDIGFHNPEILDSVTSIIIAISGLGGAAGVLAGISKIIKATKSDITVDLNNNTIDIKNASHKQIIDIFDKVLGNMSNNND